MRTPSLRMVMVLAIALSPLAAACSTIKPDTTVPAPSGPYAAAEHEAVVVFHRRSLEGPSARGDDLTVGERWSYVRVFDAAGTPLADLRATEHAVVRLAPGEHELFVKNWAAEPNALCVGALRAALEPGRVYAVEIESSSRDLEADCEPLRLVPVERRSIRSFFDELAETRSEQRAFLGQQRETSPFLDHELVVTGAVRAGTERLAKHPVRLTADDGVAWTPKP